MSFQCGYGVGCPSRFAPLGADSGLQTWGAMGTFAERLLCALVHSRCKTTLEGIMNPTLQLEKLRPREVKTLAQD